MSRKWAANLWTAASTSTSGELLNSWATAARRGRNGSSSL